ncbi:MAG: DUF885 family protein [Ilumatobacteraceae bacterium]
MHVGGRDHRRRCALLDRARAEAPRWFGRLRAPSATRPRVNAGGMAYYTAPSPDGQPQRNLLLQRHRSRACGRRVAPDHVPRGHPPATTSSCPSPRNSTCTRSSANSRSPAYSEGWGLAAERLADEMGLCATPLQRIGMLTLDSLRASRLVVDTGIHAKGWTRQQAIDFLYDHTHSPAPTSKPRSIDTSPTPGKPPATWSAASKSTVYEHDAATRLGNRFSVPRFHDTILHGGMTPLNELARRVNAWIETTSP